MTVPSVNRSISSDQTAAAFLRLVDQPDGRQLQGVLFTVDSHGYPLGFCHARVAVLRGVFWNAAGARLLAAGSVVQALFAETRETPLIVLALATETPPQLFLHDVVVTIPVGLVTPGRDETGKDAGIAWAASLPAFSSPAASMIQSLRTNGMLIEPFTRALQGLAEVSSGPVHG